MNQNDENMNARGGAEQYEEVGTFVIGLLEESERMAVIMGAARLEMGLEQLLKRVMRHNPLKDDNLFDTDRPLGTFSAKTALAHRLGLIGDDVERGLRMIRKIRNDFAHSIEKATLLDAPHKDRIAELVNVVQENHMWNNWRFGYLREVEPERRADFCAAMIVLISTLEVAAGVDDPIKIKWTAKCKWKFASS
jgi:hypothetical protein